MVPTPPREPQPRTPPSHCRRRRRRRRRHTAANNIQINGNGPALAPGTAPWRHVRCPLAIYFSYFAYAVAILLLFVIGKWLLKTIIGCCKGSEGGSVNGDQEAAHTKILGAPGSVGAPPCTQTAATAAVTVATVANFATTTATT